MSWVAVIALALLGFVATAWLGRLPREGYALFGSAMLLGLAGYALQGSPGLPSTLPSTPTISQENGEALITARREMFGQALPPARYVAVADAFTRNGQSQDAVGFLSNAVRDDPDDAEAWTALGLALVDHADGNLTQPASDAFREAERAAPYQPAPPYFLGVAQLGDGQLFQAREQWQRAIERTPGDAPYRDRILQQTARLDAILAQLPAE